MDYCDLIAGMKKYGSNESDICIHGLGIAAEQVQENVIIAPWWEPSSLPGLGDAEYLSDLSFSELKHGTSFRMPCKSHT